MTSALNKLYPADKDNFKAFLNKVFTLSNLKLALNKIIADINLPNFDFAKSIIYATNADIEKDLQSAQSTGHKNLAFSFIQTATHKKADLINATRAINCAIASYNIIFFVSSTHLSIAFATRRFHKKRTIKEDVIEKITLIKDINLQSPSMAHQLNLKSIATIKPKEVDVYYDEILTKLSISSLNKKFYGEIFQHFYNFTQNLTLPNTSDESTKRNFVLRLISRILFCKFLEKKDLIDSQIWDTNLSSNYYHEVLEPLFFTTLNTPKNLRDYALLDERIIALLERIPYLNGGLFSPQQNDFFSPQNPHAYISTLKIDNHYFDELFKTLQAYHFTIDEASHNAEEVALDPELLGQIFESLLSQLFTDNKVEKIDKNTLRKATGSYYTPREIVRYMVRSAILAHLQTHLKDKVNSQFLEKLVFGEDFPESSLRENPQNLPKQSTLSSSLRDLTQSNRGNPYSKVPALILQELSNLKILDPACGSGAFPMGILSEIIRIQNDLGDTRSHYERKLEILQNCIYGVDIQPMATEMARLRCFLSLIIDENIDDIKPLPNLEFKFINANSLLPLSTDTSLHYDGYHKDIQELERLRNEYFSSQDKSTIQKEYLNLRERITREDLQVNKNDSINNPMLAYDPFDPQSVAQFFDSAYMFGVENFDIVVGNPPYGAKLTNEEKKIYKSLYKYTTQGAMDTYKLFIERGFNLLKKEGNLNYIVPLSAISNKSNIALHKMLLENCEFIKVSSYSHRPAKVFTNAELDVSIFNLIKTNTKCKQLFTTKLNRINSIQSIGNVLNNLCFINSIDFVQPEAFCKIGLPIEKSIIQKLYSQKQTLKDLMDGNQKVYYRTTGGRYYKIYTSYSTKSNTENSFNVINSKLVVALMSSNLFWWFRNAYAEYRGHHIYQFERFPIPNFTNQQIKTLEKLGCEYEKDIEKNHDYSNGVKTYKIRKSKHIIDEIDRFICPLYDLTQEEIDFIINYDIEFRID